MPGFEKWITAGEAAMPSVPGLFAEVNRDNRRDAGDAAFDADPLAGTIRDFVMRHGGITLLDRIVLDMIKSGEHEKDQRLVVGFMAELSPQLNRTRANLAVYAGVLANPEADAGVKTMLATNAALIIQQLGDTLQAPPDGQARRC